MTEEVGTHESTQEYSSSKSSCLSSSLDVPFLFRCSIGIESTDISLIYERNKPLLIPDSFPLIPIAFLSSSLDLDRACVRTRSLKKLLSRGPESSSSPNPAGKPQPSPCTHLSALASLPLPFSFPPTSLASVLPLPRIPSLLPVFKCWEGAEGGSQIHKALSSLNSH